MVSGRETIRAVGCAARIAMIFGACSPSEMCRKVMRMKARGSEPALQAIPGAAGVPGALGALGGQQVPSGQSLASIELEAIRSALATTQGNKAKAARLLGISRSKLYERLAQAQ